MRKKPATPKKSKLKRPDRSSVQNVTPFGLNRDLSWLEFNSRVLNEAVDERTPLLERVRFLSIFTNNLNEFFMKRVGRIKRLIEASPSSSQNSQLTLSLIRKKVIPLLKLQHSVFKERLVPELKKNDIFLLRWNEMSGPEKEFSQKYFNKNIFPVLTPLAVDPGHPFPFISNLSTSLGLVVRHADRSEEKLFARLKIPDVFPYWIRLPSPKGEETFRFISLHEVIKKNIGKLFPGMEILEIMAFRITRNADLERDEDDTDDILELITEELKERRFANVVRIEHAPNPSAWILNFLMEELELTKDDLYEIPVDFDTLSLNEIANIDCPDLKFKPWVSLTPSPFHEEDGNLFNLIAKQDLLVHHPYESFTGTVEQFIRTAVEDPKVIAIKMTLYRTSYDSSFVRMLIRAAEHGKQVVCLVELKARFDEEKNIRVAQALEKAGVHVVYGIVGLKTHSKVTLVVRQEEDGVATYVHIGTGNYHTHTARLYTDLGFFTARPELTSEVVELFHYLTGRSVKRDYQKLLVAPINLKERFLEMIERETKNAHAGKPAQIIAKMNSLEEKDVVRALYKASQAGVKIDLIVRGFCCLTPGKKGLSENIRVTSIIGMFLEHARIFYFRNGESEQINGEFYIGSADWMHRNLSGRVEVITPIEQVNLKERLLEILHIQNEDHRQAWEMKSDGSYVQRKPANIESEIGTHEQLMELTRERCLHPGN